MKKIVIVTILIVLSTLIKAQDIVCFENSAHNVYGGAACSGVTSSSIIAFRAEVDNVEFKGINSLHPIIRPLHGNSFN